MCKALSYSKCFNCLTSVNPSTTVLPILQMRTRDTRKCYLHSHPYDLTRHRTSTKVETVLFTALSPTI